jgi:hypothetical protein
MDEGAISSQPDQARRYRVNHRDNPAYRARDLVSVGVRVRHLPGPRTPGARSPGQDGINGWEDGIETVFALSEIDTTTPHPA